MSVSTEASAVPAKATRGGFVRYRLTVEQFLKMIDAGVFSGGQHVELLGGILVNKTTKHDPHDFAVDALGAILSRLLPEGWIARQEKSVVLGKRWRPEPDVAVARGPREVYRGRAPQAEDLALVVEVADSSYRVDRGAKWRRYAACGVSSYWIVNIPARVVEVYTDPVGEGRDAQYRTSRSFSPEEEIPVTIDRREVGRIVGREILP